MANNITYQKKQRFYGPTFRISAKRTFFHDLLKTEGFEQTGAYQGPEITVRFCIYHNWITSEPKLVILDCAYKGYDYQRNYNILFSERGIKLICAKFIKDIKAGKIK